MRDTKRTKTSATCKLFVGTLSGACRFRTAWECQRECARCLAAAVQRDIAARQLSMESATAEDNSSIDEGVRRDRMPSRQRDSIVMNARLLEALTTSMRNPVRVRRSTHQGQRKKNAMPTDGRQRVSFWRSPRRDERGAERCYLGAQKRTRTSTVLPPLGPEPSASTNSAIWASV